MSEKIRSYIRKSLGQQGSDTEDKGCDYDEYSLQKKEIIVFGAEGLLIMSVISYVFYRSAIALLFLLPLIFPFIDYKRKKCISERKQKLTLQFREMMHSVIAGLQAGYSVEHAFEHSYDDLVLLYGKNELMPKEAENIKRGLRNNRNLEDLLADLAERSHVKDINDFSEVFRIAKRSGGNLPGILDDTAQTISNKIDVKRDIATIVAAKKMEQRIMDVVPVGIILYIDATSPGFFEPLYHNLTGEVLMTAMLAIYIAAFLIGEKILEISY